MKRLLVIKFTSILSTAFLLVLVSCQLDSSIRVEEAWGRASPMVASNGVFYMILHNPGDQTEKLLSMESPACRAVELHESYESAEGVMSMRPVEGGFIEIPPAEEVQLGPGGLHAMCIDIKETFSVGKRIELILKFQNAADLALEVEVKEP